MLLRSMTIDDGRELIVRHASSDDVAGIIDLYRGLSVRDQSLRFFAASACVEQIAERWLGQQERGGAVVVAEVRSPDGASKIVAEAGFSLLPDGDGELAITVEESWRGSLGRLMMDTLYEVAAASGVANLVAEVKAENRPMLGLLRRRGQVYGEHEGWTEVRVVVSTTGDTAGWPPRHDRPRLAVEALSGRWAGEHEARRAGFDVRTCPGPRGRGPACPLLDGRSCPLVDDADAVVVALDQTDPLGREITDSHRRRDREVPVRQLDPSATPAERTDAIETLRSAVRLEADDG